MDAVAGLPFIEIQLPIQKSPDDPLMDQGQQHEQIDAIANIANQPRE
jgi:hypothetical protein